MTISVSSNQGGGTSSSKLNLSLNGSILLYLLRICHFTEWLKLISWPAGNCSSICKLMSSWQKMMLLAYLLQYPLTASPYSGRKPLYGISYFPARSKVPKMILHKCLCVFVRVCAHVCGHSQWRRGSLDRRRIEHVKLPLILNLFPFYRKEKEKSLLKEICCLLKK